MLGELEVAIELGQTFDEHAGAHNLAGMLTKLLADADSP